MKNLSISKKLGGGFAILLILSLIIGAVGYYSMKKVVTQMELTHALNRVHIRFNSVRSDIGVYLLNDYEEGWETQQTVVASVAEGITGCLAEILEITKNPDNALDSGGLRSIHNIRDELSNYKLRFEEMALSQEKKREKIDALLALEDIENAELIKGSMWIEEMQSTTKILFSTLKGYFQRNTAAGLVKIENDAENQLNAINTWANKIQNSSELNKIAGELQKRAAEFATLLEEYQVEITRQNDKRGQMLAAQEAIDIQFANLGQDAVNTMKTLGSFSVTVIFSVVATSMFLGIVFAFVIIRLIVRPVKSVTSGLKDVAEGEGDLTARLAVDSKDEVGELAGWFNTFIEKLRAMIEVIVNKSDHFLNSSFNMAKLSQEMSVLLRELAGRSDQVAAAAHEMSTTFNSVAVTMDESSTNVNLMASTTEEMTATINGIAGSTIKARQISGKAVSKSDATTTRIQKLGSIAHDIGKITEVINEVSEQTNLLALNATIEAARAGHSGKGFAIVADEIKNLAKQTAEATNQIKNQIKDIQTSTEDTITDVSEISSIIRDIDEIIETIAHAVEQQSEATKEMANNISQISTGMTEINHNVTESSNAASAIAEDIADINKYGKDISESSAKVDQQANELAELSTSLKEMMRRFKI